MPTNIYPTKTGIIYKITNTTNGKFYIGKTTGGMNRRWYEHKYDACAGSGCHLHNAIRKHGPDNFNVEAIESEIPVELLSDREVLWISTLHPCYNMTAGGDGLTAGFKHTEESKIKMSVARKGKKHTPEHIANRVASRKSGGKKRTPEQIEKTAKHLRGKPLSSEHAAKVSAALSSWWVMTDPSGTQRMVLGSRAYCKEYNLNHGCLMHTGKAKGHTAIKLIPGDIRIPK